jgi:hypothetical protein
MIDGFHWTRVTAKQLRFIYDDVTLEKPTAQMQQLALAAEQALSFSPGYAGTGSQVRDQPAKADSRRSIDGRRT